MRITSTTATRFPAAAKAASNARNNAACCDTMKCITSDTTPPVPSPTTYRSLATSTLTVHSGSGPSFAKTASGRSPSTETER